MRTLLAVVPSAGVLFLFWLAVRAMIQADRRERSAQARMAAAAGRPEPPASGDAGEETSPEGEPGRMPNGGEATR